MIRKYNYEGKNKEDTLNQALKELQVELNEVVLNETYQEGKLFKSAKYTVEIILKNDIKNWIKEYIKTLEDAMNFKIKYELKEEEQNYYINLISDSNAILIGREGRNLQAIQTLMKNSLAKQTNNSIKIFIDASGYKQRKQKILKEEVKKIAHEVQKSKTATKLDPMNSYERLLVHNELKEMKNIITRSEGEKPNRYIVIEYKED